MANSVEIMRDRAADYGIELDQSILAACGPDAKVSDSAPTPALTAIKWAGQALMDKLTSRLASDTLPTDVSEGLSEDTVLLQRMINGSLTPHLYRQGAGHFATTRSSTPTCRSAEIYFMSTLLHDVFPLAKEGWDAQTKLAHGARIVYRRVSGGTLEPLGLQKSDGEESFLVTHPEGIWIDNLYAPAGSLTTALFDTEYGYRPPYQRLEALPARTVTGMRFKRLACLALSPQARGPFKDRPSALEIFPQWAPLGELSYTLAIEDIHHALQTILAKGKRL